MRIAVVGAGTAGYMAAAHISRYLPDVDLVHIFDPALPTIGVGEGSTPAVRLWLHDVTHAPFEQLVEQCEVTRKRGIRFEGWGRSGMFMHDFLPQDSYAYHFSAASLVAFLARSTHATVLHGRVVEVRNGDRSARVILADGSAVDCDFVFDASGFAEPREDGYEPLSMIPTDAALIRPAPPKPGQDYTRAIARPHGWVFVIPLTTRTAWGYVYSTTTSSLEEIHVDMDALLQSEDVHPTGPARVVPFPNFQLRDCCLGRVLRVGNRSSFLEPLEATALAMTLRTILTACVYLSKLEPGEPFNAHNLAVYNGYIHRSVQQLALFVSWHYSMGSAWDSPFWRLARSTFQHALAAVDEKTRALLDQFVAAGLAFYRTGGVNNPGRGLELAWDGRPAGLPQHFGGFNEASFAQVALGIGTVSHAAAYSPAPSA